MSYPQVKLGEIFKIARGGSPRPINDYITEDETGINWISIKDASSSSKYIEETKLKIRKEGQKKSRFVKPGDFILTNSMSFGRPYIMRTSGCIHDGWLVLSGDKELIDQDFFYYLLGSNTIYRKFSSLAAGAVVKNLNINIVKSVEVPLPPLPEQKRIADILDKADAIRCKRQQAIDLADEFLRSVFLDIFGDPVTNPKGWETKPVSFLADVTTGNTPSRKESKNYGDHIEWIKSDNINTPEHFLTTASEYLSKDGVEKARTVTKGSVLITCIAGSKDCIGNAAIADRKVSFNQQINALTANNNATTEYLYSLTLFGKKLIQSASTNSMKGMVSKGNLQKLEIPSPPVSVQKEYSSKFKKYLLNRKLLNKALLESEVLFGSLSQRAFSGKL